MRGGGGVTQDMFPVNEGDNTVLLHLQFLFSKSILVDCGSGHNGKGMGFVLVC